MMYIMCGRGSYKSIAQKLAKELDQHDLTFINEYIRMMTDIVPLTDWQKEMFNQLVVMRKKSLPMIDLSNDLTEKLIIPNQDYKQKHKSWKKDRFYY